MLKEVPDKNAMILLTLACLMRTPIVAAQRQQDTGLKRLVWVDREGNEEAIPADARQYFYPRISPDGSRVVLDTRDAGNDLWIWDFVQETLTRFTSTPEMNQYPVWTSDGERIAYQENRSIIWKTSDNAGSAELITEYGGDAANASPYFFSAGDTELVFRENRHPETGANIGIISIGGNPEPSWLLHGEFNEQNAELSPDGQWMAYQSDESGQYEIYVRPFPNVEGGRWQISNAGGSYPLWSPNGRELFYLEPVPPPRLISVATQTDPVFTFGPREGLLDWPYKSMGNGRPYDVDLDGQRFLVINAISISADAF